MKDKQFLYDYLNAFSPVGLETEGQSIWITEMSKYGFITEYPYGTAVSEYKGSTTGKVIAIEAHCDEIAWIITNIDNDGYIRVKRSGGSDSIIAASKTGIIHTHNGEKIKGLFGSPAIHTRDRAKDSVPKDEDLWFDVGVSTKDAVNKLGIEVGNLITFDDQFQEIGDYYVGRSLDNKIGGYILSEVFRRLSENNIELPFTLLAINSVQEEVGLHGAKLIAKRIPIDLALVHDVCHNTNHPKMDKNKDCDVNGGNGFCVEYTAQNHKTIIKKIRELADSSSIKYQVIVGSYGNDTMGFFLENIPTAIIATPLKYMHTTVEMAHKDDVESVIQMYLKFIEFLSSNMYWLNEFEQKYYDLKN